MEITFAWASVLTLCSDVESDGVPSWRRLQLQPFTTWACWWLVCRKPEAGAAVKGRWVSG